MENTNVLKTALGVGVLGTAAVALGYYYFNDENGEEEGSQVNSTPTKAAETSETSEINEPVTITSDVMNELNDKKTQMGQFWENTYKSFIDSNNTDDNESVSNQ